MSRLRPFENPLSLYGNKSGQNPQFCLRFSFDLSFGFKPKNISKLCSTSNAFLREKKIMDFYSLVGFFGILSSYIIRAQESTYFQIGKFEDKGHPSEHSYPFKLKKNNNMLFLTQENTFHFLAFQMDHMKKISKQEKLYCKGVYLVGIFNQILSGIYFCRLPSFSHGVKSYFNNYG